MIDTYTEDVYKGSHATYINRLYTDPNGTPIKTVSIIDRGTSFKDIRTTTYSYDSNGLLSRSIVEHSESVDIY